MDPWTTDPRAFRTFLLVSQIDPGAIRSRIRQARKEAGLTQQDLADLIETHKRTVENYENVRVPEWSQLAKIARVLDRPVEWFIHGDRPGDDLDEAIRELRERLDEAVGILQSEVARVVRGIEELRELVEDAPGRAGSSDRRAGPPASAAAYREAVITPLREGKGDPESLRRLAAGRRQLAEELSIVADLEEQLADQLAADVSPRSHQQ